MFHRLLVHCLEPRCLFFESHGSTNRGSTYTNPHLERRFLVSERLAISGIIHPAQPKLVLRSPVLVKVVPQRSLQQVGEHGDARRVALGDVIDEVPLLPRVGNARETNAHIATTHAR